MDPSQELNEAFYAVLLEMDPPASTSTMAKHMVRAIYQSLRSRKGGSVKDNAKAAFRIAGANLRGNDHMTSGSSTKMTGKGSRRSRQHSREPKKLLKKKDQEFQVIKKVAELD